MPEGPIWIFDHPISKNYKGIFLGLYKIDECKLNILWTLAKEGPMPVFQLFRKKKIAEGKKRVDEWMPRVYSLPKISEVLPMMGREGRIGETVTYNYSFVNKKVKELEKGWLVEDLGKGSRRSKIVGLTFAGLLLYLLGSTDKGKFENAVTHYGRWLRFSDLWSQLKEALGQERVAEALDRAVSDFSNLILAKFRVRPINLEFEGLLREELLLQKGSARHESHLRDPDTVGLLQKKKAFILKNSYLAYLAVHDICRLSGKDRSIVERLLPTMTSEEELRYIEGRNDKRNSLLMNRLKEYFPMYARYDFFLTGMFVENLLWKERVPAKAGIQNHMEEPEFEVTLDKEER